MILTNKKVETEPTSKSWIRDNAFFITSTTLVVAVASCAIRDKMNESIRKSQGESEPPHANISLEQSNEESEDELQHLSDEINDALCACNDPTNIYCLRSLLCKRETEEPMTIDRLRELSRSTSPSLQSSIKKILDRVEQNPSLMPASILIAKRKLSSLSAVDWRKHVLTGPLEECERSVLGCNLPLQEARK